MATLDRIDLHLLSELQKDGRRSMVELAQICGLSPTPCARRVRLLEKAGIIQGYTAIIDPAAIALKVSGFVQVKLERHTDTNVAQFRRALEPVDEVVSCHAITGEHDFILQVLATDLDTFNDVVMKRLLRIPCVRDVHSSIVLNTVKRSVRIPLTGVRPQ
jgi:Lrp/AsnC family leucine-responsive transcriptional regulator